MNCPACGGSVAPGQERCAVCAAVVVASVEGNLAPRLEPIRELPALRRRDRDKEREKNWKDEVSERVKRRRKSRTATRGELPLFRDVEDPLSPPDPSPAPAPARPAARSEPTVEARVEQPAAPDADLDDLPLRPLEELFEAREVTPAPVLSREEPEDVAGRIELGTSEAAPPAAVALGDDLPRRTPREVPRLSLGESPEDLEDVPAASPARPEPAQAFERMAAAAVDALVLGLLAGVVLYFTLRLTRVGLPGLWPTWPWFAGYLSLLALSYATYFSGTTGQTPGKMLTGLRVVDLEGRPPSYIRAFLRAALGGLGVAALGAGLLPLLLDSRAGALHDRLTRTQVVKG